MIVGGRVITTVEKTAQRIKDEFVEMLSIRAYSEIRVKDLANAMGMTRQNFYRYYSSKEEILSELIEDSLTPLVEGIEDKSPNLDNQVWGILINIALSTFKENKTSTLAIMKSDADDLVYKYARAFIARSLGHLARVNHMVITDHDYFSLLVSHFCGAVFHTVKDWCDKDMRVPLEDVSQMLHITANDALAALLHKCAAPQPPTPTS